MSNYKPGSNVSAASHMHRCAQYQAKNTNWPFPKPPPCLLKKYQQAEKFCKQALHIQEQRLVNKHPLVASTLSMLAKIYQGQNKLDQAKEMNMRALTIRESTSGVDHPNVATIVNSLVEIYHA